MLELREGGRCCPETVVAVNVGLACVDGLIAFLAFYQLMRIHSRNSQLGWTRQKVFHLMIGSSNFGYFIYFVLTLVAACKGWICWSNSCGFIVMALPKILFVAAFLLLLSFCGCGISIRGSTPAGGQKNWKQPLYLWVGERLRTILPPSDPADAGYTEVDLCHQSNDDEDDEGCSPREALLEKINKTASNANGRRRCCAFRFSRIRSRQKIVILVTVLVFAIMIVSSVLIWVGMGKSPINSAVIAQVYVDLISVITLLLGGALACYGLVLFLKMRKVRADRASWERWKVAGLAIVCVVSFTASASVGIASNIPLLYSWHKQQMDDVYTSLMLVLYYFIGSSLPSAFILLVMRELPPPVLINRPQDSRTITFITSDGSSGIHHHHHDHHPPRWTAATSVQNQGFKSKPYMKLVVRVGTGYEDEQNTLYNSFTTSPTAMQVRLFGFFLYIEAI
ncbi:hypothetical protein OROGR_000981 [Orobanche gracilis]